VLKTITATRGDVQAYLAVCGASPKDCELVAEMNAKQKKLADALSWVERGLKLKGGKTWGNQDSYRLDEMQRDLLKKHGRHDDAFACAWTEFENAPFEHSYEALLKFVPVSKRSEWHERAMALAEKGELDGFNRYLQEGEGVGGACLGNAHRVRARHRAARRARRRGA
jgi:hypothetical protein